MSGIVRVYKRDEEGTLHFREAWFDEDYNQFVMNYGAVGHQSKTEETDVPDPEAAEGLLDAFAVQCAEDGYAEIPDEEQFWVVAQFALVNVRDAGDTVPSVVSDEASATVTFAVGAALNRT